MADYTPVFLPGQVMTLTLTANAKGGDLLVVTGSNSCAPFTPAATPVQNYIGAASHDKNSGQAIGVFCRGTVQESVADGTVTAGDQLVTATNAGRQVRTLAPAGTAVVADINNARAVIGIALTSAADNAKVRWMQIT